MKPPTRVFAAIVGLAGLAAGFALGAFVFSINRPMDEIGPGRFAESHRESGEASAGKQMSKDEDALIGAVFTAGLQKNRLQRAWELERALAPLDAVQLHRLADKIVAAGDASLGDLLGLAMRRWAEIASADMRAWADPAIDRFSAGVPRGMDKFIAEGWARADPDAAIALALERPDADASAKLLGFAVETLAGGDPVAQIDRLARLPEGRLRDLAVSAVLRSFSKTDPAEAHRRLALVGEGRSKDSLRQEVLSNWAAKDVGAALSEVGAMLEAPGAPWANADMGMVILAAARADGETTLAWAAGLPDAFRTDALMLALSEKAKKDPLSALDAAMSMGLPLDEPASMFAGRALLPLLDRAMDADPAKVLEWLRALPPGNDRSRLIASAAAEAPVDFMEEAIRDLPPEFQAAVLDPIVEQFVRKNLDNAVAWAQSLPVGPVHDLAIQTVAEKRVILNDRRGDDIVDRFPAGRDRDLALKGLAGGSRFNEDAFNTQRLDFARQITDPELREMAYRQLGQLWVQTDPPAASAWVETTAELSPETKAWLKREIAARPPRP